MLDLPESYRGLNIVPPLDQDCKHIRGVITPDGIWGPLLAPKGYSVLNCRKRNILCHGSKKSGKTLALACKFLQHCWEIDGAVAALVCRTQNNAKIGTWRVLHKVVLEGYLAANFGMRIAVHKHDPSSKMEFYVVTNAHYDPAKHGGKWDKDGNCTQVPRGGTSQFELHSLHFEQEVEDKFKSAEFTMVWLSEADLFHDKTSFNTLSDQLRGIGVSDDKRQFIIDANPPEEGEDHWLHEVFWSAQDPESRFFNPHFHDDYARFDFNLDDNPFLPEKQKQDLKVRYKSNPAAYQRFIEGKMVKDATTGAFADVFMPNIHVVGEAKGLKPEDWSVLVPGANTSLLLTGTDTGDISHASSFIAVRYNEKGEMCFDQFDEICFIERPVMVAEFLRRVIQRVDFWTKWMKDEYGTCPEWHHHADSQVFLFDPRAGNDAQTFYRLSEKRMHFIASDDQKRKGAVAQRIAMVRRLLFEDRLRVSAHCFHQIGALMFMRDKKKKGIGKNKGQNLADKRHSHAFVSLAYALEAEIPLEGLEDSPPVAEGVIGLQM